MASAKPTRVFHHPRKTRTDKLIENPNLLNRHGSEWERKLRRKRARELFRWFDNQKDMRMLSSFAAFLAFVDVVIAATINLFTQVIGDFSLDDDSGPPGFSESIRIAFSRPNLQTEQELSFNVLLVVVAIFATLFVPIMLTVPSKKTQLPDRAEFAIFVGFPSLMVASILALYLAWQATGFAAYGRVAVILGLTLWVTASIARSFIWRRAHASSFLNQRQQMAIHKRLEELSVGEMALLRELYPNRFVISSYALRILVMHGVPLVCACVAAPELWRLYVSVAILTTFATTTYLLTVVTSGCKRSASGAGLRVFSTSLALTLGAAFVWVTVAANEPMVPRFWVAWIALFFVVCTPLLLQMVDRTLWDARVWHLAAEYRLLCELQLEEWECYQRSMTAPTAVQDQLSLWSKPSWRVPVALYSVIRGRQEDGEVANGKGT